MTVFCLCIRIWSKGKRELAASTRVLINVNKNWTLSRHTVSLRVCLIYCAQKRHAGVIVAVSCCWQLKRLSTAVSLGGGRSQQLEEGSLPRNLLESPQSCVVDVVSGSSQPLLPSSTTEWANSVKSILQRSESAEAVPLFSKSKSLYWQIACLSDIFLTFWR